MNGCHEKWKKLVYFNSYVIYQWKTAYLKTLKEPATYRSHYNMLTAYYPIDIKNLNKLSYYLTSYIFHNI